MKVEQIYTGCLAQGAYYIESNGEAAIIDPLREVKPYLAKAEKDGSKIKYILETHFHADFVSGHLDLAKETGAQIVYGPSAQANFEIMEVHDRQVLKLGNATIEILHTPGHTTESSCYLLRDEEGLVHSVFTGDTVFLGDVGRPDLAVKSDLSREQLAAMLYNSIWTKIMPLPDKTIIYPGHGAGSACGKNMSSETVDTLGRQKESNYALQPMSEEEFVKVVLEGQTTPPQYFPKNVMMNKMGYDSITDILERGLRALSPDLFETAANETGALILDTRHERDFVKGFIPNSIFIGVDGSFAPWVGTLITDLKQPILIVAPEGREEEVVTRLSRVGYDNTIGYLEGGIDAWRASNKELDELHSINAETFAKAHAGGNIEVLDVRRKSEFENGHVKGAKNSPLDHVNDGMSLLDRSESYFVHCKGGYRSVIMSSILKSRGFENVINVEGGFDVISKTPIHLEEMIVD